MGKDKIDEHFDYVEKLIERNNDTSERFRQASNKAYYNQAIDHAINIVKLYTAEDFPNPNQKLIQIINSLNSLKKK